MDVYSLFVGSVYLLKKKQPTTDLETLKQTREK